MAHMLNYLIFEQDLVTYISWLGDFDQFLGVFDVCENGSYDQNRMWHHTVS